jgi:hypothetical protein
MVIWFQPLFLRLVKEALAALPNKESQELNNEQALFSFA